MMEIDSRNVIEEANGSIELDAVAEMMASDIVAMIIEGGEQSDERDGKTREGQRAAHDNTL